jgi:peptidoglycan hydrolase-like protein with peptidoglycan-binding domain
MAASEMRRWLLLGLIALTPSAALGQSAGEVERCFQNPGSCSSSGGAPAPAPPAAHAPAPGTTASAPARAPDYATVLNSPDPDRRKLQESLRTLDKYSGPIDGNLQSEGTMKGIGDWQRSHGLAATGKLTPSEAVALNNEAGKAPIRRLDPSVQVATAPPPPAAASPSNADALKSLRSRLAERRKAAEPKADAAAQSLVADLKAYVAADGKGAAGEQFAGFAKWYAETRAAGRTVGEIKPAVEDYGDAKAGSAATTEVSFETKQGDKSASQCLVFAWIEGSPRKSTEAFSCDDVAAVEKWKTDQALRSAWR